MDKILLIEDDARERALSEFLKERGYEVLLADGKSASQLVGQTPDIIVTVLNLKGSGSLETLRQAHQVLPETPVVIMTGHGTIFLASVVEAMRRGVFDCLTEPLEPEELLPVIRRATERSVLQREVRRVRQQVNERGGFLAMVGQSQPMWHVFEQIQLVAPTRSTILITGESGTGKELVARAIHQLSPRKDGSFVVLNCVAIPKELAESELFGHTRGSFTGATENRIGKFAAADRGTLLIDEIGEMELPVQAKLLRTLETRTVSPIGSNEEKRVDVRVLAATHRNLRAMVEEGKFREDLYYRLHVVHIDLPPLRQRREDIPLLVDTFLQQLNREHGRHVQEVSPESMDTLRYCDWPGNVRELRNVLEGIVVLLRKEIIEISDLPLDLQGSKARETVPQFHPGITLSELEREAIQQCLIEIGGNRQQTARLLGISTRTLLRKIRQYGLEDPLQSAAQASVHESHSR